jgi:hypothetical protein
VTGNVPALRNQLGLSNAENVLQRAYIDSVQANPVVPALPGIVPRCWNGSGQFTRSSTWTTSCPAVRPCGSHQSFLEPGACRGRPKARGRPA